MLYCYRCRHLIQQTSERWIKRSNAYEKGRAEHEVVCFDCLNLPFCQTENCTNPKKTGSCQKCGKQRSHCEDHTPSHKLRLLTAICNYVKETRKMAQDCEKSHYRYEDKNVCKSCFDSRCMGSSVRCGTGKSECWKCSTSLDTCWRHAKYNVTENDEYERSVCGECYIKYQCFNCGLHREGTACELCHKMFCYECQSSKLKGPEVTKFYFECSGSDCTNTKNKRIKSL